MPSDSNQASGSSSFESKSNTFNLDQLSSLISKIVSDQNRLMLHQFSNPTKDLKYETDQVIEDKYLQNLSDLDKIPDVVKCIREFSGQPGEFSSWKKSVDRILDIYSHLKGTPKYYGILNIIRNKIVGHADIVLESYNTPLSWERIAKCLTLHYADKRDLGTLEYQMTTLIQGSQSIPEFYQSVYQHLSLILNKLSCIEMGQESINNMTQCYREKALDTFIRGLKGDLPRLLSIREPSDLPEALHLCLKLQNMDYRMQYANNSHQGNPRKQAIPPPLPIRRNYVQTPQQFFPQLLHNPQSSVDRRQMYQNNQSHFQTTNPRYQGQFNRHPLGHTSYPPRYPPKPNPKPVPMEVDGSVNSKRVNYMNRPQNNQGAVKRPHFNQSQQVYHPNKAQRIYHQELTDENQDLQHYQEQLTDYDTHYEQTLVEYTEARSIPGLEDDPDSIERSEEQEEIEALDDINFLD